MSLDVDLPVVMAGVVLFVALPLNWYVTYVLWRLHQAQPGLRVLRERGIVSTCLSLLITVFALIFLNNDLVPPPIEFEATKLITRGALIVGGMVPPLYWLWLYRHG